MCECVETCNQRTTSLENRMKMTGENFEKKNVSIQEMCAVDLHLMAGANGDLVGLFKRL